MCSRPSALLTLLDHQNIPKRIRKMKRISQRERAREKENKYTAVSSEDESQSPYDRMMTQKQRSCWLFGRYSGHRWTDRLIKESGWRERISKEFRREWENFERDCAHSTNLFGHSQFEVEFRNRLSDSQLSFFPGKMLFC